MSAKPNTPTLREPPLTQLAFSEIKFDNTLPVLYLDSKYHLHKVSDSEAKFLRDDMDVSRLNEIHRWLHLCGRSMAVARPLHRQVQMNSQIIVTEQADLHLTWNKVGIFIKPLPLYLLDRKIWINYYLQRRDALQSRTWILALIHPAGHVPQ